MPDLSGTRGTGLTLRNADAGLRQLTTAENVDARLTFFRHSGIYLFLINRQQYRRAGCTPFHNQHCERAGRIPVHSLQCGRAGCIILFTCGQCL